MTTKTEIYKRYFRVTAGPLIEVIQTIREQQTVAVTSIRNLVKELGAHDAKMSHEGGVLGFTFDVAPDSKLWKRTRSGWYYPKQNSNAGRELVKRIKGLPEHPSYETALRAVGLHERYPVLIDGSRWYSATLTGHVDIGVWFVSVPWRDADQEEIEQYKKDKSSGSRWSASLEHLLWEPPVDLVEVKEWQVLKEIDEMNEKLRGMRNENQD